MVRNGVSMYEKCANRNLTFIILVNDEEIFKNNLLASPVLLDKENSEIIAQRGFSSAATGYNAAIEAARNDLLILAHQDIFFPTAWYSDLRTALEYMEKHDPEWGVLGCYGTTKENQRWGYLYSTKLGIIGEPLKRPMPVQTLDEVVLVIRKSSGLHFNESLQHFHLYGTDICLAAADRGRKCYAISAFCIHNTNYVSILPKEFYQCYNQIKARWYKYLPIQTPCVRITKLDKEVFIRKMKGLKMKILGKDKYRRNRVRNPHSICDELDLASRVYGFLEPELFQRRDQQEKED